MRGSGLSRTFGSEWREGAREDGCKKGSFSPQVTVRGWFLLCVYTDPGSKAKTASYEYKSQLMSVDSFDTARAQVKTGPVFPCLLFDCIFRHVQFGVTMHLELKPISHLRPMPYKKTQALFDGRKPRSNITLVNNNLFAKSRFIHTLQPHVTVTPRSIHQTTYPLLIVSANTRSTVYSQH